MKIEQARGFGRSKRISLNPYSNGMKIERTDSQVLTSRKGS